MRSGLEPDKDIDIVYTGLRPGEKIYEELYWKGEGIVPTKNKKITMLKQNGVDHGALEEKIQRLHESMVNRDVKEMFNVLKNIVPESTIKGFAEFHNSFTKDDSSQSKITPVL